MALGRRYGNVRNHHGILSGHLRRAVDGGWNLAGAVGRNAGLHRPRRGLADQWVLLILRRRAALGVYALLLILTLIWAWFEVGLDRWALLPRYALFSLFGLWLLMPWIDGTLQPEAHTLRSRGWFGARGALAVTVCLALVLGLVSLGHDPFGIGGSLPNAMAAATPTASAAPGANWTAYGGNGYGERYSSLKQITT